MMSVNNTSAFEKGTSSLNSSGSSAVSIEMKPLETTWAEEMMRADLRDNDSRPPSALNSSSESIQTKMKITSMKSEPADNDDSKRPSQEREISLEFLDGANEQKFERLVKEEKLKTPFKRRHSNTPPSNNSRSNSPNSSSNSNVRDSRKFNGNNDEKRLRHNSHTSSSSSSSYTAETDPAILARRQKQIDYGKSTLAYSRYTDTVQKSKRTRDHPHTPNKYGKYSRRAFDGLIKIWRKQLHYYDPPSMQQSCANEDSSDSSDVD